MNGWIFVDKPKNITSFKVIKRLKKILNIKKIGHSGTLDPFATGILAIALGEAFDKALGDKKGISRFGQALSAMDETLSRIVVDCSNRPHLAWRVKIPKPKVGEMDTELFKEWFQAFSQTAGITLHIENLYGENSHHIVESCFKGLARSLREAIRVDDKRANEIPSTKGTLGGSL